MKGLNPLLGLLVGDVGGELCLYGPGSTIVTRILSSINSCRRASEMALTANFVPA